MQPGSTRLLTQSEVEEAFKHAPTKYHSVATWHDSNNLKHRDGDLPAEVWRDGGQGWYQHGKNHRANGLPAEIVPDGTMYWCEHDELHRDNGLPAVMFGDGTMSWHENGEKTGDQDNPPPNAPEIFFNRGPGQKTKSASKK